MRSSFSAASTLFVVSVLSSSGPAWAGTVAVNLQGVLIDDLSGVCTKFIGDDGQTYVFDRAVPFTNGERIQVSGSYSTTQYGQCFTMIVPLITVTSMGPGFAGVGTVVAGGPTERGQSFVTDDGRRFGLLDAGRFTPGTQLYLQGKVVQARSGPMLLPTALGPPYAGFGRVTFDAAGFTFVDESGERFTLDRPGSLSGIWNGASVYLEGIRGARRRDVTSLTSVTARPAFESNGIVIATPTGRRLIAGAAFFDDQVISSALDVFPVGAQVYLRGRSRDDFDFGEVRSPGLVRLGRAALSVAKVGTLDVNARTVTATDGTLVRITFTGDPNLVHTGSTVYVAGPIGSQSGGEVTLSYNELRPGIAGNGTLLLGFGCSPIIRLDSGGYVFPKNNAGLPLNSDVHVEGGLSTDAPCADEPGLIDNSVTVVPGCTNCQ